jgi:hypothetical protein
MTPHELLLPAGERGGDRERQWGGCGGPASAGARCWQGVSWVLGSHMPTTNKVCEAASGQVFLTARACTMPLLMIQDEAHQ